MPAALKSFSPRILKDNLRETLGAFVVENRLGQYLDFNVVVIPTGKHVTKFPTADAAFHPYEGESGEGKTDEALEIRVVPWLIAKITSSPAQSEGLADELRMFWMAGVEEVWELAAYADELRVHAPKREKKVLGPTDLLPETGVLPGFYLYVKQLFHGIDDEQTVLPEAEDAPQEGWDRPVVTAEGDRVRLKRRGSKIFVPAPDTDARDVYRDATEDQEKKTKQPVGFGSILTAMFSSWPIKITVALVAGLIIGTIIQLASDTKNRKDPFVESKEQIQSSAERERILSELTKQTIRDFFAAETIDGKLAFVRNPEEVRPMMETFYQRRWGKLLPKTVRLFGDIVKVDLQGKEWSRVDVWTDSTSRRAFLEPVEGEGGEFRMDWPSFVGFNATPIGDSLAKIPEEPVRYRVRVTTTDKQSGYFAEKKYQGFVLNFPLEHMDILGYMDRGAKRFARLEKILDGQYQVPLILTVAWPKDRRKKDEVEILDIVSEDWLLLSEKG